VVVAATVVVVVAGATVVVVTTVVVVVDGDGDSEGEMVGAVVTTGEGTLLCEPSTHGSLTDIAPIMDIKRTGTTEITERLRAEISTNFLTPTPATTRSTAVTRRATSLPVVGNLQISVLNTVTPYWI
jgi:hypothetical protein